jgi:hypothetical protein
VDFGRKRIQSKQKNLLNDVAEKDGFMTLLVSGRIYGFAWNKIYKRELLKNRDILFPAGLIYEDLYFNITSFHYANTIGYVDTSSYYYVQRSGSSIRSFNEKKISSRLSILNMIRSFLERQSIFEKHKFEYSILLVRFAISIAKDFSYHSDHSKENYLLTRKAINELFIPIKAEARCIGSTLKIDELVLFRMLLLNIRATTLSLRFFASLKKFVRY